jgi:formylglycine-generating enzyme required for sulfatase activity
MLHRLLAMSLGVTLVLISRVAGASTPCTQPVEGTAAASFAPAQYTPGQTLQVTVVAHQYTWGTHFHLEDQPPSGWVVTAASLTPAGSLVAGRPVWDLALAPGQCQTFTYSLTAAANASGTVAFTASFTFSSDAQSQVGTLSRNVLKAACTAPGVTAVTSPTEGQVLPSTTSSVNLVWSAASGATSYDVQFGLATPPPFLQTTATTSLPVTVASGQTYHAQILAKNGCGSTSSAVRSFVVAACASPAPSALQSPTNAASVTTPTVTLRWSVATGASSYDVHFGTASPPPLAQNVTGTSLDVPASAGATYHWSVVARNGCGTAASPEWSFTTAAGPQPTAADVVILGAAHLTGLNGTVWRTDLEVCNRDFLQGSFTVAALLRDQANPAPQFASFTVSPNVCASYPDVLASVFALSGAAALRITPLAGAMVVSARTYNLSPAGTFGAFAFAQGAATVIAPGRSGLLVQLGQSASDATGFRTNIGVANLTATAATALVDLYRDSGALVGTVTIPLQPFEYVQKTKAFSAVTSAEVADGYAVVRTTTAGAALLAEASVIDNRTGDPVTVQPAPAPASPAGSQIALMLPGGIPLTLVRVSAGSFAMGTPDSERGRRTLEGPVHQVTLSRAFLLGHTELTRAQWQAIMGSVPTTAYPTGPSYPVTQVSWNDVAGPGGFLEKLNAYLLSTGQPGAGRLRLPTEAEWEYAARSGSTTRFPFGDSLTCADGCEACPERVAYLWWCGDVSPAGTRPVAQTTPNAFGLVDMSGNVWEWVADWIVAYPASPVVDPTGPATGAAKGYRGGAWPFGAGLARSGGRFADAPTTKGDDLGFRVAFTP